VARIDARTLTRELLAFNTINPPGMERACARRLGAILEEAGYAVAYHEFAETRTSLIARIGGNPVGFAIWFSTYSTFLSKPGIYLEDLFVRPDWRGKGIGRALLRQLARIAVERGYGRIEWSVLDWNETAIRFYRSISARAMDEWTVYRLTGDAITRLANS